VLDELRVYRQEVVGLAFAIAAPAVEAIALGTSRDDPATIVWNDLLSDLRGTTHGNPYGASGLLAFEQLRGLLLAEPTVRCSGIVAPWALSVFAEHDGIFFRQGRGLLDALAERCVPSEDD
jgi:hypothetical protein